MLRLKATPAEAHASAIVLSGVDASAGSRRRAIRARCCCALPVLPGPPAEEGATLQVDVDGCIVTGAAHGDLSSEKVYVRFRTVTCTGPEPGTVIETEVAEFVAGSGVTGVRDPGGDTIGWRQCRRPGARTRQGRGIREIEMVTETMSRRGASSTAN